MPFDGYLSVGQFRAKYTPTTPRDVISAGFSRGWFNAEQNPLIAGRRLIAPDQVYPICAELRRRGYAADHDAPTKKLTA